MKPEYSERVKKIFNMAKEDAIKFKSNYLSPEHVLLAILEEEGPVCTVLKNLGVELDGLKSSIIDVIVNRKEFKYTGYTRGVSTVSLKFNSSLQKVMQLSFEEARMMRNSYVDTEHLLLGIIQEKSSDASRLLHMWGLDAEIVRYEIMHKQKGNNKYIRDVEYFHKGQVRKGGFLKFFSRDITELAKKGKLDPIIGRKREMERIIEILGRRKKNNPVLLGEAGVGKTAIVEGLAQEIIKKNVPQDLYHKKIVSIDIAAIIAGTKYRGQFEERLRGLISEVKNSKDIILFMDEIHTIVGAGAGEGALDASNILKPVLARGEIQIIGSSTFDDYRRYIERNPALERRFQPVIIESPSVEETINILKGVRKIYEDFHKVKYQDESLYQSVKLAEKYITDRQFPDKALDIIDEAGARGKLYKVEKDPKLEEIKNKIEEFTEKKMRAIELQEYEKASFYRDEIVKLEKERDKMVEMFSKNRKDYIEIKPEDIVYIVSMWTGIPLSKLEETEREKLLKLEDVLKRRIVAQDHAIELIAKAIRRSRAGVKDPRRPTGVFMFLGPTGVGKTELARTLADYLFGDPDALIRIDMSEYMEKFNVSKLIGAPPGYVGYEEGGQLTERVRRRPYSVVLFDEIEKAHPEIFNILLQIMEDGQLTDSFGRKVNFRNTIIIMTSNVATSKLGKSVKMGFEKNTGIMAYDVIKEKILNEIKQYYRAEFLNRIDEIIVFKPLERENMEKIVEIMLNDVKKRLEDQGIIIEFNEDIKELLIEEGFDPEYGARPLRRSIRRILEEPLSEEILKNDVKKGIRINTKRKGRELTFSTQ